jgi:hypothetical protein
MAYEIPPTPTNVQTTNPYVALDRGLFLSQKTTPAKYARIHAARWVTVGPEAAVGVLEYQVMVYNAKPTTAAQYAAGTLLVAPGGGNWFDAFTRGLVIDPIMAEYWAIESFTSNYIAADATRLKDDDKADKIVQAQLFVSTMASWAGLKEINLTAVFNAVAGQPLSRTSMNLSIDYEKNGTPGHLDVLDLPSGRFDPVHVALDKLRNV